MNKKKTIKTMNKICSDLALSENPFNYIASKIEDDKLYKCSFIITKDFWCVSVSDLSLKEIKK